MTNITVNEGTAKTVKTRTIASEEVQAIYLNVGTTSDNPFSGTILEVSKVASGTVSVNTPGTITSGTVSVNTPGTITSGTVSVNTPGTIASGSIVVTDGTVKVTTPGTITSGSISVIAGTEIITSGSIAVTDGTVKVVTPGTITSGSISVIAGTIGQIPNIPGGTINAATVSVNTPGTITSGSIAVTAGTGIITSGSIVVTVGTIGGKAASGAAAVANPVQIAGTDSGGTIYSPLVTTAGAWGSVSGMNVLTTLNNLTNGTVRVTAGTINTGTVNDGTLTLVTTVSNLTNGTIRVTAGTVNTGTINAGTINAATINTGTINAATINVGTVRDDGRSGNAFLTFGTTFGGTGTAAAYATLVSAPGASNYVYVDSLSIKNPYGTLECAIGYGTAVDGGSVLEKGVYGTQTGIGIVRTFPHPPNGNISNQPLVLYKSGLGTVYANVTYMTSTV